MKRNIPKQVNSQILNINMTQQIDTDKYIDFVKQVTSPASRDINALIDRMRELEANAADIPRLLTAALGMSAECGELVEIIKKILLQGKAYSEDNVLHMKKEAGDVLWYLSQLCIALNTTFEELMEINYQKLSSRYPEGTFSVYKSENRVKGDI